MSYLNSPDERAQNFLAAVTEAVLEGEADVRALAQRYDIPIAEAESLASMVRSLEDAFVDVSPSRRFKRDLRAQLIEETQPGMLGRLQNLPPRVQIAAVVAIVMVMALLGRRRMLAETTNILENLRAPRGDSAPQETPAVLQQ